MRRILLTKRTAILIGTFLFEKLKLLQNQLNASSKLSNKSSYPATSSNTYTSVLETVVNNKKLPCTPPLFQENKFITKFKEKVDLLNNFFTNQCTLLNNSSVLRDNLAKLTNESLDTVNFSTDDISKIII